MSQKKQYLNLSEAFNPFFTDLIDVPSFKSKGEMEYEFFTFKGGEPHIKIKQGSLLNETTNVGISTRISTFEDVGKLMVAVDALRRMNNKLKLQLVIPYFPGARQDRVMIEGEPLTVKVYADLINNMKFDNVIIFDPHSEVTPALLNNVVVLDNHKFVLKVLHDIYPQRNSKVPILISPDAGSNKKIGKLAQFLSKYNVVDVVKCDKTRNVKTGEITNFEVYTDDLKGRDCVIVDDICDGGGTFNGLAAELKKKNCGKLYLVVSHGIFSSGFGRLLTYFDRIYTTDSGNP